MISECTITEYQCTIAMPVYHIIAELLEHRIECT